MATVLITGSSSGFGLCTARRFARRGDRVFATVRDPGRADALHDAIAAERLPVDVLRLDVCDAPSVEAAVGQALARAGRLDVLVNNAGVECRSSIEDADDDDVLRQFDTNVFGALRVLRAVLPAMRAQRSGTIVNVSSIAGLVARPFGGLYSASKHALEAISEALHFEVQPYGIRVVLIEPGQYATRLLDSAWPGRRFTSSSPYWERSARMDASLARLRPGGVAADPEEVAALIVEAAHAAAPRLRNVVGQDAVMIAAAHRQMEFEDYERAMRATLDWQD